VRGKQFHQNGGLPFLTITGTPSFVSRAAHAILSLPPPKVVFNKGDNYPDTGGPGDYVEADIGDYKCVPPDVPKDDEFCQRQEHTGYYANTLTECQAFYVCDKSKGTQEMHICPNMTIFHQQFMTCIWAPLFDCSQAERFYYLNDHTMDPFGTVISPSER
jgi:hypothetical protein